ncbi:MAG: glycosyltransferase family 4 protein [Fibromonadales bacterium]|nr:glycosyltransferase family 4 protein [Fibromonadales bacterium]
MNILVISNIYFPDKAGGAEIIAQKLAESLHKRGHRVNVLATSEENCIDTVNDVTVHRVKMENFYSITNKRRGKFLRMLWHFRDIYNSSMKKYIREIVNREKPDIALVHNMVGFSISIYDELKSLNIPFAQVLHDRYVLCPNSNMFKKGKICKKQCFICKLMRLRHVKKTSQASAVIGVSESVLNVTKEHGYFANVPGYVIYNTMDVPKAEHKNWNGTGELKIGFIGTLAQNKGVEWLIKEFARLKINARLTIAGSGYSQYVEYLKGLAKGNNRIKFIGFANAFEFYSQIHLLAVPSLWHESFGLVAIESLASGVPVIASKMGGLPEIVKKNANGLFCFPESPNSLGECIVKLYEKPELLEQMSVNARDSVGIFLNVGKWIEKYENVFREVMK